MPARPQEKPSDSGLVRIPRCVSACHSAGAARGQRCKKVIVDHAAEEGFQNVGRWCPFVVAIVGESFSPTKRETHSLRSPSSTNTRDQASA